LPAAQFAMAAADMHHRTPEFRALFLKVLAQLKVFVGTKNDVLLLACSGTGAMEASVSNLTSPGDRVLVLSAGKFGERWTDLAKAFGCEVDVLEAPYGQTFEMAEVKKALRPEHRVIYMQASETSTAVSHDVEAVAAMVKDTDTLLVVDGITGLGTQTIDVDGWGVDIVIGGSQKAVMIPPGLAYLSVSEKAWAAMEKSKEIKTKMDIAVVDSGEGIPEEELEHIFDRFYRVDKARERENGGTGLGLAIAKEFIQAHGGFIKVESKQGSGSCFKIFLPVSPNVKSEVKTLTTS